MPLMFLPPTTRPSSWMPVSKPPPRPPITATLPPMATAAMERANYLLWIAHNLDRTADRATNIAERVIFTVSGRIVAA